MTRTKLVSIIAVFFVTVLGLWYFVSQSSTHHIKPWYTIEHPQQRNLIQYVTATGTLRVLDQISVGSIVTGKVLDIMVDDNDIVKKDQVLATIDNGIGDTAVKRLKALLEIAQAKATYQKAFYKRQKALFESGQISHNLFEQYTQDYQVALATVEQIQAELEIEEKTYENLFIRSPRDGIVIAKNIDLGQIVQAQLNATVLFLIGPNLQLMEGYVDVDQADIGQVKQGQEAFFTVDAFPKEQFCARIKRIEFQAKVVDNIVTYATILDIKNQDLKLRPGMTTNVDIRVANANNAISISNKALRINTTQIEDAAQRHKFTVVKHKESTISPGPQKARDFVWILENNNTLKQIEVVLGVNDGKYSHVISGINEKTSVITEITPQTQPNPLLKGMFGGSGIGR